jgi:hypothetical protein
LKIVNQLARTPLDSKFNLKFRDTRGPAKQRLLEFLDAPLGDSHPLHLKKGFV